MLVVLVTPSASPDCLAVLDGLYALGVRAGLVCHTPADKLPPAHRSRLAAHVRVDHVGDAGQILAAVDQIQATTGRIDRLIGFAEVLQVQLADVRAARQIPGLSPEVARNFRDKNRMKAILRDHGLPVAPQALLRSAEDAIPFVRRVGWPIVLKPTAGVGSQGTFRAHDTASLIAALQQLQPTAARPVQAEAFVTGTERTFETVLVGGQVVWCSQTYYLNRPLEILENPWMQWTVLFPREPLDEAARTFLPTNVAALQALGLHTGMAHLEWFVQADGTAVISEVGARPPGARFLRMLGQSYDADLWARWAELEVFGRWTPLPERRYAVGCAFFRAQGSGGRITSVNGLDRAQQLAGAYVIDRDLPAAGAPRKAGYEGDGWAVVRHERTEVVHKALRDLITQVQVRAD